MIGEYRKRKSCQWLQKVGRGPGVGAQVLLIGHCTRISYKVALKRRGLLTGIENLERILIDPAALSHIHNASDIPTPITIIRSGPNRHQTIFGTKHELVTLLHQLVRSGDEGEFIDVIEFIGDGTTEEPTGATRGDGPGLHIVRIGPH